MLNGTHRVRKNTGSHHAEPARNRLGRRSTPAGYNPLLSLYPDQYSAAQRQSGQPFRTARQAGSVCYNFVVIMVKCGDVLDSVEIVSRQMRHAAPRIVFNKFDFLCILAEILAVTSSLTTSSVLAAVSLFSSGDFVAIAAECLQIIPRSFPRGAGGSTRSSTRRRPRRR